MATKPYILLNYKNIPQEQMNHIHQFFRVVSLQELEDDAQSLSNLIQGLFIFPSGVRVTESLLQTLPNVKIAATHSVGLNHIDMKLFKKYGIRLGNTPYLCDACADMAFTLILALARRLIEALKLYHQCELKFLGTDVFGTTIGIMGMGGIGFCVAQRARGFKMRVLYHNRRRRPANEEAEVGAIYCNSLDEMLPEVDFFVISAPLTEETRGAVGAKQFALMKNSAFLINVARGPIVDQEALVDALKTKSIKGAGLDVTTPEPLPQEHDLLSMPNVIVTPHMSSGTSETRFKMVDLCVKNLLAGLEGRELLTEVQLD